MEAYIYTQSFEEFIILDIKVNEDEYIKIPCNDGCNGTGTFWITNEDCQECVNCKGAGYVWVNIL